MYSHVFEDHAFFRQYMVECPQVMRKVCHSCVSPLNVSMGDVIFDAGETPSQPKVYVVGSGSMKYLPATGQWIPVQENDWLAEAALWTHWVHQGTLMATNNTRLTVVDAALFQKTSGHFDHGGLGFDPKLYAQA